VITKSALVLLACAAGAMAIPKVPAPAPTAAFRAALEAWTDLSIDAYYGLNFGDKTGSMFTYESNDGYSMTTSRLLGASLSKWPSAVMISAVVADGKLKYTDLASKYLTFWDTDKRNPRSKVTLQTLLSFTSGLLEDATDICELGFEYCAQRLYKASSGEKQWTTPNTTFQYLSGHLQFAGAMAAEASGIPIQNLFKTYLYEKFNMTSTSYGPLPINPSMAAGIVSTGDDFENMLYRLITDELPAAITSQMEHDWTAPPISPTGDGWFGHYGMGHWWECLGYGTPRENEQAALPQDCMDAHIQAGPGEFGFYPLVDRSGGGGAAGPKRPPYYMQVPLQEPDALSGIPEYLRLVAKPAVDLIMSGVDPSTVSSAALVKAGGALIARDITFIQGELGECRCTGKKGKGQPYATLMKGLPEDNPKLNRREILATGAGITIFDIAKKQKELGKCTCEGRKNAVRAAVPDHFEVKEI